VLYARVIAVPFNQDSGTLNTIRFRVNDTACNRGTQSTATAIQVDSTAPGAFTIYSPTSWVTDTTPTVIGEFSTGPSGVDNLTVQYAYATNGNLTPINWTPVDGVYEDAACTNPAEDGDTGVLYTRILAVPFNQDSGTLNTIRFRANDTAGNRGTQAAATAIRVDSTAPGAFAIFSPTGWVTDTTPTVIGEFSTSLSGVDNLTVQYAYDTNGNLAPTNWAPVDGVYEDAACMNPAESGATGVLYARILAVPFNQDSAVNNTIRFRANDTVGNRGTQATATTIQVDSSIGAPLGLNAEPSGWTIVNSFNLSWTNPSDLTGIAGAFFKLDSPPGSDTDGTYVTGVNITEIVGITVSGEGAHVVYVWLNDTAGNINFSTCQSTTLYLTSPISPKPPTELIIGVTVGVIGAVVFVFLYKFKIGPKRKGLKKKGPKK